MDMIEVGSQVLIKTPKIIAYVIGVSVSGGNMIEYRLSFWNGNEHKTEWLFSFEIEPYVDNSRPVGFGNTDQILIN